MTNFKSLIKTAADQLVVIVAKLRNEVVMCIETFDNISFVEIKQVDIIQIRGTSDRHSWDVLSMSLNGFNQHHLTSRTDSKSIDQIGRSLIDLSGFFHII